MYRQSKFERQLDSGRPSINLGSNERVKFKRVLKRNYQWFLKSPFEKGDDSLGYASRNSRN